MGSDVLDSLCKSHAAVNTLHQQQSTEQFTNPYTDLLLLMDKDRTREDVEKYVN